MNPDTTQTANLADALQLPNPRRKSKPSLADYNAKQLELMLAATPQNLKDDTPPGKSNTFEMWESFMYFAPQRIQDKPETVMLRRRHGGVNYLVHVTPSLVSIDGTSKLHPCLPSKRERKVMEVVEMFACTQKQAQTTVAIDGNGEGSIVVTFTLGQLRKTLAQYRHKFSAVEIMEAFNILANASLMIVQADQVDAKGKSRGRGVYCKGYFDRVCFDGVDIDLKKNTFVASDKTAIAIRMHSIVTRSALERSYRNISFANVMAVKTELAHTLYCKMTHNFTQANKGVIFQAGKPYSIKMSTLLEEQNLPDNKETRKYVRGALKELSNLKILARIGPEGEGTLTEEEQRRNPSLQGTFSGWKESPVLEMLDAGAGRPKVVDVELHLYPHPSVVEEIIEQNEASRRREHWVVLPTPEQPPKNTPKQEERERPYQQGVIF